MKIEEALNIIGKYAELTISAKPSISELKMLRNVVDYLWGKSTYTKSNDSPSFYSVEDNYVNDSVDFILEEAIKRRQA